MVKFALFGAGRIGKMHAGNLASIAGVELVYVYDVYGPAAQEVAGKHGAKIAPDVETALGDPAVDAVLIASSTDTHIGLLTAAAKAGKAILCEKPIDLDIARVNRCRAEIAGCDVAIQIGFNRRFDPTHRGVRDAVRAGEVGQLEQLIITSRDPAPAPLDYLKGSGGLFRDMMIHDFDLARFIMEEEPVDVMAAGSVKVDPAIGEFGDVDTAMVVMRTASGILCHINCSRRAVYGYDQRVEAFGSKGMVRSKNRRATEVERFTQGATEACDPVVNFFIERYPEAYRGQLVSFAKIVGEGGEGGDVEVGFEDGRRALLLADAAEQSLRTGRAVTVNYD